MPWHPDQDRRRELAGGLAALQIDLTVAQIDALLAYLDLLQRWNRVFNLTAVREPGQMVGRHLLDSLSILRWVDSAPVLDVGTGAGLPGIPLAVALPHLRFVLLDTNGKKTRFVQQAAAELGLANVAVVRSRVERFDHPAEFAVITTRAYASLPDMVAGTARLLAPHGCWLAMKGQVPQRELDAVKGRCSADVQALQVPGETAARHLVILRRRR